MAFDFAQFLQQIDPLDEYDIERLNGGLVNIAVRAKKYARSTSSDDPGLFPGHSSLILKYAPPYIAAVGESAPFSQYRQVIEARALEFLATNDDILAAQRNCRISIPKLLYMDIEQHVLVLEDLGSDLVILDEWLAPRPHSGRVEPGSASCNSVAARVGIFMAALHTLDVSAEVLDTFVNPATSDLVKNEIVGNIRNQLEQFQPLDWDADEVSSAIRTQFEEKGGKDVFSIGDFWTGSILVNADGSNICIVDWEFAGAGKPLQDMTQLAAHLHLLSMSAPKQPNIVAFAQVMHTAYRIKSEETGALWLGDTQAIQSAWILHGREMIANGVERDFHLAWSSNAEEQRSLQRRMVEKGCYYVSAAKGELKGDVIKGESFLKALYLA